MKILELLGATKEEREKKAVQRAARTLSRNQDQLIDSIDAELDKQQEIIDNLLNIKADNIDNNWNRKYQDAKVQLELTSARLKIAKETKAELFSSSK
jgi:hypothetical protein